tara:strand:- start:171 stop:506 length:336 start_codon:yes stop_codon:yes gene_type:complete
MNFINYFKDEPKRFFQDSQGCFDKYDLNITIKEIQKICPQIKEFTNEYKQCIYLECLVDNFDGVFKDILENLTDDKSKKYKLFINRAYYKIDRKTKKKGKVYIAIATTEID